MKTNALAVLLGAIFLFTGLVAFFLPQPFFDSLGSYYGVFNLHFVKDAGIAFFGSGVLLLLALRYRRWQIPLTLGGAMFVVLHGLFHVQMLLMGMVPSAGDIVKEIALVITPAALTALLLALRLRQPAPLAGD